MSRQQRGGADDAGGPPDPDGAGSPGSDGAEPGDDGGSTIKKWAKRFVIAVVALVGLLVILYLLGVIGVPTAGVADRGDWGNVTENRTEIVTTVWVDNPNPIGLSLGDSVGVDYDIRMNSVLLAEGSKSNFNIPTGNSTRELRTDIHNNRLNDWWAGYVRADETVELRANATLELSGLPDQKVPPVEETMLQDETPVIDALSASINSTADTYTENVSAGSVDDGSIGGGIGDELDGSDTTVTVGYEVERGWATWESVSANTTTVRVHMDVHNPGDVPVPAEPDGVEFTTEANGVDMFVAGNDAISTGSAGDDPLIDPSETREITFTLEMDNDNVDDWFTSHVRNEELTELATRFHVTFQEPTTGATFRIPDETAPAHRCEFQTAILVDDTEPYSDCQPPEGPQQSEP